MGRGVGGGPVAIPGGQQYCEFIIKLYLKIALTLWGVVCTSVGMKMPFLFVK